MNDQIVEQIRQFAESLERRYSEENSYAVYAAYEIINDILEHPMMSADQSIVNFFFRMQTYSELAPTPKTRRIFEVAMDTADMIQAMI